MSEESESRKRLRERLTDDFIPEVEEVDPSWAGLSFADALRRLRADRRGKSTEPPNPDETVPSSE